MQVETSPPGAPPLAVGGDSETILSYDLVSVLETLRAKVDMTTLRHFDHLGTARFVTFSCFHRFRLLTSPLVIMTFLEELQRIRVRHQLKLYGYVVMLEHVHLVLWPPRTAQPGRLIGQLKSLSARRMLPLLETQRASRIDRLAIERDGHSRLAFWQVRCYDHNCRTPDAVREKIEYCH